MEKHNRLGRTTRIDLGFAADPVGNGIACARVVEDERERLLRVPFSLRRLPALRGRDVTYAAVSAVAGDVRKLGITHAEFRVGDDRLAADLAERRMLPGALSLPYVRLRCALNQFRRARVAYDSEATRDPADRARSEIGLLAAA